MTGRAELRVLPVAAPDGLLSTPVSSDVYPLAPQPVFLVVDLQAGELTAATWAEVKTPERHVLAVPIPCLTASAANRLLEEVRPLAQRVLDGYSNNRGAARFTDDAVTAQAALTRWVSDRAWNDTDVAQVWHASTWLQQEGAAAFCARVGLTADTTDFELAGVADLVDVEVRNANEAEGRVLILHGLPSYLREIRDGLRQAQAVRLQQLDQKIADLEQERDRTFRRMTAWGWSVRSIAKLTRLTHPTVGGRVDRDTADRVLERLAAGRPWFDNSVGHLVYDDSDPAVMRMPIGGGEVQVAAPGGWTSTGVVVSRPVVSPLGRRTAQVDMMVRM